MKINSLNFNNLNIIVIGDVMLDRYLHGHVHRISPEAPIPIVHVTNTEERPGGAANVALNIAAMGAKASLFAVCGHDHAGAILTEKLREAFVEPYFEFKPDFQTIIKQRVVSLHQQLLRLDFEELNVAHDLNGLIDLYSKKLSDARVVVFSDYGKGIARKAPEVIAAARKANVPVIVDPKGTNFSIYQGATLLTPNRKEFEAVVGPCQSEEEMRVKALQLIEDLNLTALLITRGEQGMTLFLKDASELHLPARVHEVYDVTGAGDTVIAFLALALADNWDLSNAAILANIAASIVVGKLGAATVSPFELKRVSYQESIVNRGVVTEQELITIRQDLKSHGERVVMTNGCFDILHAGHVAYLEQAKALGDRLIVAVNDDASVARLKGSQRPINPLERRMAVLAGLSAVDWVVPFSEDTPERLITHVLPDVLVKGGDYQSENIAGAKAVLAGGGQVEILGFLENCSTSLMINKIQEVTETS